MVFHQQRLARDTWDAIRSHAEVLFQPESDVDVLDALGEILTIVVRVSQVQSTAAERADKLTIWLIVECYS